MMELESEGLVFFFHLSTGEFSWQQKGSQHLHVFSIYLHECLKFKYLPDAPCMDYVPTSPWIQDKCR